MAESIANDVLPNPDAIQAARDSLIRSLPEQGLGTEQTVAHIRQNICPGLNRASISPNYYGFVTGGSTKAASLADNIVTEYDNSVQVHLPLDSIATDVEDAALRMLLDFVDLPHQDWPHRTFTTGATASNIIGLACGREWVVKRKAKRRGVEADVCKDGLYSAMLKAKVEGIEILTTVPHSSLKKAASIVGLGTDSVKSDFGLYQAPHNFDFEKLELALQQHGKGFIVAISMAEVNTGFFATSGNDLFRIRELCDKYSAWLHIDAAFGLPARLLPSSNNRYAALREGVRHLELADSITGDAHKLFNVPYDCGIFLSRHLTIATQTFQNIGAAYLSPSNSSNTIPSPLNIGIENSRRFRALPVYATLAAYGRAGYLDILERQIDLARSIATYMQNSPTYQLLPQLPPSFDKVKEQGVERIYIVVLFRAHDDLFNEKLVSLINGRRKIYVSGTKWNGQTAARFAVSNWQVDVERDLEIIKQELEIVAQ